MFHEIIFSALQKNLLFQVYLIMYAETACIEIKTTISFFISTILLIKDAILETISSTH